MSWVRRLKRLFCIEIEGCARCGGKPRIIAKSLSHLERTAPQQYPTELLRGARAPPVQSKLH